MEWTQLILSDAGVDNNVFFPVVGATLADPFILKGVDGLGPPEIDVIIKNTPHQGGVLQNTRPQLKQVVMRVGLNPNYAINQNPSDLRAMLYNMLTGVYTGNMTYLRIFNVNDEVCRTYGQISKMEINPWSKDPEVQITLDTLSPYLQAQNYHNEDVSDLSLTDPTIQNLGNAPVGFYMKLTLTDDMDYWELDTAPVAIKRMRFDYDFLAGDTLTFNTVPGQRFVHLDRDGDEVSILSALSSDSEWFVLNRGLNSYSTSSDQFEWVEIYYKPQFWGV